MKHLQTFENYSETGYQKLIPNVPSFRKPPTEIGLKQTQVQEDDTWRNALRKIGRLPIRQDSVTQQLQDLIIVADRFGFSDAVVYLKKNVLRKN
jgi:hypothetical protein